MTTTTTTERPKAGERGEKANTGKKVSPKSKASKIAKPTKKKAKAKAKARPRKTGLKKTTTTTMKSGAEGMKGGGEDRKRPEGQIVHGIRGEEMRLMTGPRINRERKRMMMMEGEVESLN